MNNFVVAGEHEDGRELSLKAGEGPPPVAVGDLECAQVQVFHEEPDQGDGEGGEGSEAFITPDEEQGRRQGGEKQVGEGEGQPHPPKLGLEKGVRKAVLHATIGNFYFILFFIIIT